MTNDGRWLGADENEVRAFLTSASMIHDRVLDERELEALRFGYRERVTTRICRTLRNCRRSCPASSPPPRAREAGFDGVELHYARLHDGVVPERDQHARRRLRRGAREPRAIAD